MEKRPAEGALSAELGRDPLFREQYAGGVPLDKEFEDALGGPHAPRLTLPPATQPLGNPVFANPLGVRLR